MRNRQIILSSSTLQALSCRVFSPPYQTHVPHLYLIYVNRQKPCQAISASYALAPVSPPQGHVRHAAVRDIRRPRHAGQLGDGVASVPPSASRPRLRPVRPQLPRVPTQEILPKPPRRPIQTRLDGTHPDTHNASTA